MTLSDHRSMPSGGLLGLHELNCRVDAEVVGFASSLDKEDQDVALRLLEIGFLPGETVRVIARGYPGHDPLAVRVGHTTFALRGHEAALVQVRVNLPSQGVAA
jgi:ferrous iron transport protein A